MRKGEWRHVRIQVTKIRDCMQQECETSQTRSVKPKADPMTESHLPVPTGSRQRKSGPIRVLEICTWTCMMGIVASKLVWGAWEPTTLPGYDLQTTTGRNAARRYLLKLDPDFVAMAPRCTEWSQMQNINQRTPIQVRHLRRRRQQQRIVLSFFDEVAQWQHERGRHGDRTAWMIENPLKSLAWQQAPLVATAATDNVNVAVSDACVW